MALIVLGWCGGWVNERERKGREKKKKKAEKGKRKGREREEKEMRKGRERKEKRREWKRGEGKRVAFVSWANPLTIYLQCTKTKN
jgi:hypothetical protein